MRVAVFATVLALAGCATTSPPESQVRLPAPYTEQGVSVTVDGLWRNGYGNVVGISGTAVNESNRDLTVCQITLDILDASGVKVSSALAIANGLKAGQKWRFQATFLNPYAVSFRSIEPGQITTLASQQASQPQYQSRQSQLAVDQLKTALEQITAEATALCAREEYAPLRLHTACNVNDITLEQLADKSNLAATDKPLFSKVRSELNLFETRLTSAFRTYRGSQAADLAMARERADSLFDKNALALYGGTINWGEYNN